MADNSEILHVPERLIILQTDHWLLNHRVDSALPGYLILESRVATTDLWQMPKGALTELGMLLARAQHALSTILQPEHLYIGRYGHAPGRALHFHLIPVCGWVKKSFFGDPRYRVLQGLSGPSCPDETDGAELTLYVWREFCENPSPPAISGPRVDEVVARLKLFMVEPGKS